MSEDPGQDPRLRFRVWVGGQLVADEWIDVTQPGAQAEANRVQAAHATMTAAAHERGEVWLCEVYDPAQPEHQAYLRFGTDRTGMHDPAPVGPAGLGIYGTGTEGVDLPGEDYDPDLYDGSDDDWGGVGYETVNLPEFDEP